MLINAAAPAAELVEYKGAVLIRQEDRGVMVFKTKDGEVKTTPTPALKGYDLNGKEYLNNFAAVEKKEPAVMLLKVGNEFDIKINKANAKTYYLAEVRLLKGEPLAPGSANKMEKPNAKPDDKKPATSSNNAKKPDEPKPDDNKPAEKKKDETRNYANAVIKRYENKKLTFECKGEEVTLEVAGTFKAIDRGRVLSKDDRFQVFKEGNVATINTKNSGKKEVVTDVKVTKTEK
jgi:hypothetical protein